MVAVPFAFTVINAGARVPGISFASAIASPGFASLKTLPGKVNITDFPTVEEIGQGDYFFMWDAETYGEAYAIMDAGNTITGAGRYISRPLPRDSSRIVTALPAVAVGAAGGLPAVDASGAVKLSAADSPVVHSGTATAGGASSITLQNTASATVHLYRGCTIKIIAGTGAGQTRHITSYIGLIATVDAPWTVVPDATSVYVVLSSWEQAISSRAAQLDPDTLWDTAPLLLHPTVGTRGEMAAVVRSQVVGEFEEHTDDGTVDILAHDDDTILDTLRYTPDLLNPTKRERVQ